MASGRSARAVFHLKEAADLVAGRAAATRGARNIRPALDDAGDDTARGQQSHFPAAVRCKFQCWSKASHLVDMALIANLWDEGKRWGKIDLEPVGRRQRAC